MVRKKNVPGALILCLLLSQPLWGLERTIELGRDSLWKDMVSMDGVTMVPGRWGLEDLALSMGEYAPDGETEFLFHFDSPDSGDAAKAYRFEGKPPAVADAVFALGNGSAVFQGGSDALVVSGPARSQFSPGSVWKDFTIELWIYPSTLSEGETVLAWEGGRRDAAGAAVQSLRASFRDRRLVWSFDNLFTLPDQRPLSFSLDGTRQLIPRVWHHHLVRFDSTLGLLEYLIDGVPEAIVHTTDTGREGGSVAVPRIGVGPGQLVVAPEFTGFLDELRMSRAFVEEPAVHRFQGKTGMASSAIIDLGFTRTRIARIESVYTTPSDSAVAFYYKVSDVWTNPKSLGGAEWKQFSPSTDFGDTLRGRYVQLMVELFPDGARSVSPRVSSLTLVYEPNLPPTPPVGLTAAAGNGKVTLSWRKVNDLNVKGYRIYYGEAPHTYLGSGSSLGDSPIDVGDSSRVEVGNLENGKLYYFSVAAYDDSDPPQQSVFSAEVSARPSRIYQ